MAQLLTENASKTGLQINQKNTKVMNLKEHPHIKIKEEELEVVTDFTYMSSNINVENRVQKYISARINKTRNSYCSLRNIWKFNVYSLNTKVRLFKSSAISVLLSGESTRIICTSWMYYKPNVYGGSEIYSSQIRYIQSMRICTEGRKNSLPISYQIRKQRMR